MAAVIRQTFGIISDDESVGKGKARRKKFWIRNMYECIFSIIIVCKNEEKRIRRTIESILCQTYPNWECIIIDGASVDDTIKVIDETIKGDNRIKYYSELDSSIYNAMNKGLYRAIGDYIYFLNAGDTFYDKDVLLYVNEKIRHTDADIVIGGHVERRHEISNIIMPSLEKDWSAWLQQGNGICHQAIFAKKKCIEYFDEKYRIVADYDWLCTQVLRERKFLTIDVIICNYDAYGVSGLAKNWEKVSMECIDVANKNFPQNNYNIKKLHDEKLQRMKVQRMYDYLNEMFALKQKGIFIQEFFKKRNIKTIAIYGFHYLGQRFYYEMLNSDIEIKYVIDRNKYLYNKYEIKVYGVEDNWDQVDIMVVTPIFEFYSIKSFIEKRIVCEVISIEDILIEMYM